MLKTRIFVSASGDSQKRDTLEMESFFRRISDCYVDRGHYFSLVLGEDFGDTAVISSEISDCALAFFLTEPVESALLSPFPALPQKSMGRGVARSAGGCQGVPPSGGGGLPDTYKAALNSYNKTGKPKIFVYTKTQWSSCRGDYQSVCKTLFARRELGVSDQLPEDGNRVGDGVLDVPPHEGTPIHPSVHNSQFSILNSQFPTRPYTHPDTLKLEILMQIKQLNLDGVDIHLEDGKAWL